MQHQITTTRPSRKRKRASGVEADQEECSDSDEIIQRSEVDFEYVVVERKMILKLFEKCTVCDSPVAEISQFSRGCVLHIKFKCREGHCNKWASCEDPSKFVVRLCGSLLLNGINFVPILNFSRTFKMLFPSNSTYYRTLKNSIAPVINDFWVKYKNQIYEEARAGGDLWIAGDGQYDSPGFSAKYVTYSIMDIRSKKILDFVLLQ